MRIGASERESQQTLCRLAGHTRQAYHKRLRSEEREAIRTELVIQEVARVREKQKRIGARKPHYLLQNSGRPLDKDGPETI